MITLPGEENIEALIALLDPNTVTGRVARITLLTQGDTGETMSLAFPKQKPDPNDGDHEKNPYAPVIFPAPPGHRGAQTTAEVGKGDMVADSENVQPDIVD